MPNHHSRTTTWVIGLCCLLVALATGCGQDDPRPEETPSWQTNTPEEPEAESSPSPGEETTLTIRQSTQGRAFGLEIGVSSTSDEGDAAEASLAIHHDTDQDDQSESVEGPAGESATLDSGHTVTIDEVEHTGAAEAPGEGSGAVTVTVTAPE